MRYALAAVIVVAAIGTAKAEDDLPIPLHDVDRACAGLGDKLLLAPCVRDEQFRYNYIKAVWRRLSTTKQKECIDFAKNQGPEDHAYYHYLANFVSSQLQLQQQENDQLLPPPKFQK